MTDAPTTGHCHNENYMKTTHPFVAPVLGSTQSKVNMEAYEQANTTRAITSGRSISCSTT